MKVRESGVFEKLGSSVWWGRYRSVQVLLKVSPEHR